MPEFKFKKIGNGELGGKGHGFLTVCELIKKLSAGSEDSAVLSKIRFPKTYFLTTGVFREFIKINGFENLVSDIESGKVGFEEIKKKFQNARFPENYKNEIIGVLEEIRTPMAVRSSSLLEDQKGASFAGKYESVLIGNQGSNEARLESILSAIKRVYASTFNDNALAYRKKHDFMKDTEEMAVLLQEIVGSKYRNYYLPAMAGVAFSQNGYCWNKEINKKDGLVRLVFGLGTRAVGRGYVRLFSPAKPAMRPEGTDTNNIQKCSQKKVDVIDLETNELKTVHFRELITDGFNCYPGAQNMVSLRDGNYLYRPVSNLWDAAHVPILSMDGVLSGSFMGMDIGQTINALLRELEKNLGYAVDCEFAVNTDPKTNQAELYLLQTRSLSESENRKPIPLPDLKDEDVIFIVNRNLPTAHVPDIEYLVYVDDVVYHQWPHNDKQSVARVIGKINESLKGKRFALIGPGRWGSWNPDLGVPVNYAEISHTALLVEVARRRATYVPEVSFGSHFFQDLIEDNIAYLPLYPDEPGEIFNEKIFSQKSHFKTLLPDDYYRKFDRLIKIIHVPEVTNNRMAHAIMNGEIEKAVVFFK